MNNKIPCGGFYLSDTLGVDENGKLGVNGGEPYKSLVTDGEGNAKWATVNSVIYRGSDGELSVDKCMEIDGYPASIGNMMEYGSILLVDDVKGVTAPCVSAFNSGLGYFILTFVFVDESSTTYIKIKAVGSSLEDGKISIIAS